MATEKPAKKVAKKAAKKTTPKPTGGRGYRDLPIVGATLLVNGVVRTLADLKTNGPTGGISLFVDLSTATYAQMQALETFLNTNVYATFVATAGSSGPPHPSAAPIPPESD